MKTGTRPVVSTDDALRFMTVALEHEWAVSFEYLIHAYSMPKGRFFYEDPVMKHRMDVRAQTIQIGIDEMYHALQLGIVITRMGGRPSFRTDDVVRYPRIADNLKRDKQTEDLITRLYRDSPVRDRVFPKVRNMALNLAADEIRHGRQFEAMIAALESAGHGDACLAAADPAIEAREDVRLIHEIMAAENELMHRYLRAVMMFSEHQDLAQRLFKNSIDHMRHWDKNAGLLIKLGTVMRIENAEHGPDGGELTRKPMPTAYPGRDRRSVLKTLLPAERAILALYERLEALGLDEDVRGQVRVQMALKREHLFTQECLLANALSLPNLK
jgi:bacterioferritin (cytochrome b1)